MKIAAIGCSFTNYAWPSYADVLQADNYGLSGIGNDRIWHILLHLYKTGRLDLYDGIIVQWTGPYRFDYYTTNGWTPNDGNISTSIQNAAIWKSIKGWYNEKYELERSENYVIAAKSLLQTINIKAYLMSMTDEIKVEFDLTNLKDTYKDRYNFTKAAWTNKPFTDGHPTIENHIKIAEKIANAFEYDINKKVLKRCKDFHQQVLSIEDFSQVDQLYRSNFPNRYIATCL